MNKDDIKLEGKNAIYNCINTKDLEWLVKKEEYKDIDTYDIHFNVGIQQYLARYGFKIIDGRYLCRIIIKKMIEGEKDFDNLETVIEIVDQSIGDNNHSEKTMINSVCETIDKTIDSEDWTNGVKFREIVSFSMYI